MSRIAIGLRPSTDADLEWIVEVRADVLRDDLERLGRFDPVRVRQRMRDGFSQPNTRVITVDDKDVGSVSVRQEVDARWIEHFYIIPAMQGQGIGSHVMDLVLHEQTTTPLRLNVLSGSSARRLYERHGFVVDSEDDVDVFMTYNPTKSTTAATASISTS